MHLDDNPKLCRAEPDWISANSCQTVDDDASPEVLESMGVAANIHEDDTITPDGGKLIVGHSYAGSHQRKHSLLIGCSHAR